MSKLLLDESPLIVIPSLAVKVGLNEAIILQQIHYWVRKSKDKWVYNSYKQWQVQFPFFSESTIKRAITNLKKKGILIVEQKSKKDWDRSNHYTIDYEVMDQLNESDCTERKGQIDPDRKGQIDPYNDSNMTHSSYSTENTTENTTETTCTSTKESTANAVQPKQNEPAPSTQVFNAYVSSMKQRYGKQITPARNAKVNGILSKMIERIGLDGSILVASNYPFHNNGWYVQKVHSVEFMLQDCEALLIQCQSGQMITKTGAYQADKSGHFQNQIQQANNQYDSREAF